MKYEIITTATIPCGYIVVAKSVEEAMSKWAEGDYFSAKDYPEGIDIDSNEQFMLIRTA
jgi:hypothetical protein